MFMTLIESEVADECYDPVFKPTVTESLTN